MSLCIIDAYNIIFRAFYSLPSLVTSNNVPIGAVYGFLNVLIKFMSNHRYTMLLVALDTGKITFRKKLYDGYKANRHKVDDALQAQFSIIREAIHAFGLKVVEVPGFEADDIIATYTRIALEQHIKVEIISTDKDLIQLMNDSVKIFNPLSKIYITPDSVKKKFGVKYSQIVDYLSIVGDASDNIPGVKYIGPKTAVQLLQQFETLENIYNNLEYINKARIKELLINARHQAFLSKKLIILNNQVPVPFHLEQMIFQLVQDKKRTNFLHKYELKSLTNNLTINTDHKIIDTEDSVNIKIISINDLIKLKDEIETFGKLYFHFTQQSFSCYFGTTIYQINVEDKSKLLLFDYDSKYTEIMTNLQNIFEDISIKKICFDVKQIMSFLQKLNIQFNGFDDISLLAHIIYTSKRKVNLEYVIQFYNLNYKNHDAFCIYQLHMILRKKIADEKQFETYELLEKPLIPLLIKIEKKGVKIDKNALIRLGDEFQGKLNKLENDIFDITSTKFNIASYHQVGQILFERLKLSGGKKSKKSQKYMTNVSILEKQAASGILVAKKIIEWRHYSKLISTYIKTLKKSLDNVDYRIHTNFSLTTSSTGRLSSQNPNLQNIPIKTKDGNRIRKAFVANDHHFIVSGDYSQIELRVLAHIANVKNLKDAFIKKKDIHSITASQIFNIPLKDVNSQYRRKAKAVNFGIIYGQTSYGLANILNISNKEASRYITSYFQTYPGIKEYMDKTISFATKYGYVKTEMGRKCFIENIKSQTSSLKNIAKRAAINARIQGTASEIMKKAMINMDADIKQYLIMQIHDELLFEIPKSMLERSCSIIKEIMQNSFCMSVPGDVNISYGSNWYDMKKVLVP